MKTMLKIAGGIIIATAAFGLAACGGSSSSACAEGNTGPAGKVCHHGVYVTPKAEVARPAGPPACSAALQSLSTIRDDISRMSSSTGNTAAENAAAAHLDSATEAVSELRGQVHNATWQAGLDSGLVILGRMRTSVAAEAAGDYGNAIKPLVGAGPGYVRLLALVETKICQ